MLMAAAFGLQRGGSALRRLVVIARSAHLVLRPLLRSPSGALGPREAQIAQERLGTAVGFHCSAPSDNWCERAYIGRLGMDRTGGAVGPVRAARLVTPAAIGQSTETPPSATDDRP
jgi:hypothetical protein